MISLIGKAHGRFIFDRRKRVLARHLAQLFPQGVSVLDVGCGDGQIDALVMQGRPDIEIRGIDVLMRPETYIPVSRFFGSDLPFEMDSFDTVAFVDVLHHAEDQERLLQEAVRVARRCLVIKDHLAESAFDFHTLRFMDWVGNRAHNVQLPYRYRSEKEWRDAFRKLGWKIDSWRTRLGLYPKPFNLIFERSLHFLCRLSEL